MRSCGTCVLRLGRVILQRYGNVSPPTGLLLVTANITRGFRTRARLVRPSGAGVCEGVQRKCPRKNVLLSIVTEAFVAFYKSLCGLFRPEKLIGVQTLARAGFVY